MVGRLSVVLGLVCSVAGCGAGDGSDGQNSGSDAENLGSLTFELSTVPTGVACVRIVVTGLTGQAPVTKDFASLTAGTSTVALNMDRLPLGIVSIAGAAYQTTCGTGSALYVSDLATTEIEPGIVTKLPLTFRKNNPVTANVNFVGNIQAIAAAATDTALVVDGQVYTWGANNGKNVPTLVSGLSNVIDIAMTGTGTATFCALKGDGTIWCWGSNDFFQAGVSSGSMVATPTQLPETDWTAVYGGGLHFCASKGQLKSTKCWGFNNYGQLGVGTTTSTATPTALAASLFSSFAATGPSHGCIVLATDLRVMCAGGNSSGQLGNGVTSGNLTPSFVSANTTATSVAAGYNHSCAVTPAGAAACWGANSSGQLGIGTTSTNLLPTPVSGLGSGVLSLKTGSHHTCARLDSGGLRCWGSNSYGQLGDDTQIARLTPVNISLPGPVDSLATGSNHTCAVTEGQDVYCWGYNYYGQLGDGSFVSSTQPVKVRLP